MDSPYVKGAPSFQQTLDLFSGKWASRLPLKFPDLKAGWAPLFDDPRIEWARAEFEKFGVSISGSSILELGPLEGGHTYMLSQLGAKSVTAVESHSEAYLKCLVAKELLGVERVNFLLGDGVEFLKSNQYKYDIGFASGILYHLHNPIELIELMCGSVDALFLWTMYWDEEYIRNHPSPSLGGRGPARTEVYKGFKHVLHEHSYGEGFSYSQFWGGSKEYANWMEEADILGALEHFGFKKRVLDKEYNEFGPALKLVAVRG